ncbi:hypothetical protein [Anaerovibrio lipolyticus]|uniref:hypothetical protein n=1 Tax=Anaerovibrio lipolyticus TaxID=82374 RepID=UPI0023F2CA4D|nr:hypothetical protein [Anaerovibrio lipolyticus]
MLLAASAFLLELVGTFFRGQNLESDAVTACSDRRTSPVVGTGPPSGGWVYSQLSSDTIRAFHGIAGIRDVGMTGKDLGPMLLGVYSAVRGIFSSQCFRHCRWLPGRMVGQTP